MLLTKTGNCLRLYGTLKVLFDHIGSNRLKMEASLISEIFGELDYQTLVKCIEVNQFWCDHILKERVYLIRKLQQGSEEFTEFTMEWKKVLKKTPMRAYSEKI